MHLLDTPQKQKLFAPFLWLREGWILISANLHFWFLLSSLLTTGFIFLFSAFFIGRMQGIASFFIFYTLKLSIGGVLFSYCAKQCAGQELDLRQIPESFAFYWRNSNFWLFVVCLFCVNLLMFKLLFLFFNDFPLDDKNFTLTEDDKKKLSFMFMQIGMISQCVEYFFFLWVLPLLAIFPYERLFSLMQRTWRAAFSNFLPLVILLLSLFFTMVLGISVADAFAQIFVPLGILLALLFMAVFLPFASATIFRATRYIYLSDERE